MKKLVLLTLFYLLTFSQAQSIVLWDNARSINDSCDIIVMKNGDEINAKIIEITQTSVKYKKCDLLQGPTYTVAKNDIFMIKYPNGDKDVFNNNASNASKNDSNKRKKLTYTTFPKKYYEGDKEITRKQFKLLLRNNPMSNSSLAFADFFYIIALIDIIIGTFIFIFVSMLFGAVFIIGYMINLLISNAFFNNAIKKYNADKSN